MAFVVQLAPLTGTVAKSTRALSVQAGVVLTTMNPVYKKTTVTSILTGVSYKRRVISYSPKTGRTRPASGQILPSN